MMLSIIIPVINEKRVLPGLLDEFRGRLDSASHIARVYE